MSRWLVFMMLASPATAQFRQFQGPQGPVPTGKGLIEGSVVDGVTHEPIKKARVTLAGPLQGPPVSVTDAGGRFAFRMLPQGNYWLTASKPGYETPQVMFGAEPSVRVNLGSDEEKKGVEVTLIPGGSISGRVLDEEGSPLRNCSVAAMQPSYEQGKRMLHNTAGGANTNEKGEYRIYNLPPGRFYVFARCQAEVPAPHPLLPRGDPRTPFETYAPRFYGAGLDPSAATRLAVNAGASLEGIDFEMRRIPGFTLRGSIASPDPEVFSGALSVILLPANQQLRYVLQFASGTDPQNHSFQFRSVLPGSYVLIAFAMHDNQALYARRSVEIGTTPPEPLELSLLPGVELKGQIQFDSSDHPPMENTQLFLTAVEPTFYMPQAHAEVNKDGSFTLAGVVPGRWRLMVNGPGYVKSLSMGGQQVSPQAFQIPAGATGPLRVMMGTKMGEINVTVSGPAPDRTVSVLLYPEDTDRMGTGLERASAGSDRMQLSGIPPGRYRLFATDTLNPWPIMQRPDLLKALEGSTQPVDVTEGGKVSATVEVISREQLKKLLEDRD